MAYLLVFMGGGVGSIFRFALSQLFQWDKNGFPIATLLANVISSFILGLLIALFVKSNLTEGNRLLFMVGFCGGFSTFSTFSAESLHLISSSQYITALIYIVASVILGLVSVFLGMRIYEQL